MIIIALLITCCYSLTFYLHESKQRCFLDEYPSNTVIIGTHQLLDKPLSSNGGVELTV